MRTWWLILTISKHAFSKEINFANFSYQSSGRKTNLRKTNIGLEFSVDMCVYWWLFESALLVVLVVGAKLSAISHSFLLSTQWRSLTQSFLLLAVARVVCHSNLSLEICKIFTFVFKKSTQFSEYLCACFRPKAVMIVTSEISSAFIDKHSRIISIDVDRFRELTKRLRTEVTAY